MTKIGLLLSSFLLLVSCQSSPNREPNFVSVDFDTEKVSLLKWAAQRRILFQMSNSVFQDIQITSLSSSCKKLETPAWADVVFQTLNTIKQDPSQHRKVHVIEIKQAEQPYVSTSQDLDGLNYLIVAYAKKEQVSVIKETSDIPCGEKASTYMNQEKKTIWFDMPTSAAIQSALKNLTRQETPDRWKFKTGFLVHLAERMTVFRVNPELNFERSAQGESFLAQFLNDQANAIVKEKFITFDYWLNELSLRSHSSSYLKIFNLVKDKDLTYGMGSVSDSHGFSYPYLTYKVQDGHYTYPSLSQLNKCLGDLSSKYKRSLASINSDISTNSDNFLYPGYVCR